MQKKSRKNGTREISDSISPVIKRKDLSVAFAENDAPFREVVGADLNSHLIARDDTNVIFTQFTREMTQNDVLAIIELNTKRSADGFTHNTRHFNRFFFTFAHSSLLP